MTTTVKISACVSPDKEVVVDWNDGKQTILQNGDVLEVYVYDGREVAVRERFKDVQTK